MFGTMSLKAKLMGMTLVMASLTAILGLVTKFQDDQTQEMDSHIRKVIFPASLRLGRMRSSFNRARLSATRLGVEGVAAATVNASRKEIDEMVAGYEDVDSAYSHGELTTDERVLFLAVDKIWDEHKTVLKSLTDLAAAGRPEDRAKMLAILNADFVEVGSRYNAAMMALISYQETEAAAWGARADAADKRGEVLGLVIIATSIITALLLGFFMSRNLSNNLSRLSERLAAGARSTADAARQISQSSTEASAAATETAAALQETVASIDEVSAMVAKNADNAKRSFDASTVTNQAAGRGKQAVDDVLKAIDEISRSNGEIMAQTDASNVEISSIVKIIAEIGNKTKVINDIVFQTKLLSFNASVEAARAGEHGKGFAVVAEEVGNLAQMSGTAAKEISQLLDESIRKVDRTVAETKSKLERLVGAGRDKVDAGTVTARRCGEALDEIVRQVADLNHMVNEISTASREQAQGVHEISKALGQIDQGMQQGSAVASQSAAASEALTAQALTFDALVGELAATVHGGGAPQRPRATPAPLKTLARRDVGQVVAFRKKPAPVVDVIRVPLKMVAGDDGVPAENDPRFEDI